MPHHDVAVYAPFSSQLLTDPPQPGSGGAELQMTLVARALARAGLSVCQVVYPLGGLPQESEGVRLIEREGSKVGQRLGGLAESAAIWRALRDANARTVIHRTAGPEVAVSGAYCRLARRRFIYSSSSNVDFTGATLAHRRRDLRLHRLGLRLAQAVVVQTEEQRSLARGRMHDGRLHLIRSIAEPAEQAGPGEAFLWAGGAATYKNPAAFLDLAEALPELRFAMVLAGRGDSEDAVSDEKLLARAAELPNVEACGAVSRDELLARITKAVAVVNTSDIEGMPNTFLEAWARGVPALSLSVDPDGLIARHDLGAVADGSWQRFLEGARKLWAERERRSEQVERIRSYVLRHHAPEVIARRWLELVTA